MRRVTPTIKWLRSRTVDVDVRPDLGPCWEWQLARSKGGYGLRGTCRSVDGRLVRRSIGAHRLSWELHNGSIPPGACVLHKCDNPPCVNPAHLFIGNHKDNAQDKVTKGRLCNQEGVRNPNAVLTTSIVRKLRKRWKTEAHEDLCVELGISYFTARLAATGITWKCVTDVLPVKCRKHKYGRAKDARKGMVRGKSHHQSKLTDEMVGELRRRWGTESSSSLEAEFGISHNAAWCAATGRTWKHIPM